MAEPQPIRIHDETAAERIVRLQREQDQLAQTVARDYQQSLEHTAYLAGLVMSMQNMKPGIVHEAKISARDLPQVAAKVQHLLDNT
jgi:hypothetical protein